MTRQGGQKKHGDRELNAMRFNLKEQRVLQKNLNILDAEASYSLKLIDLDNRGVKVFYKRFKDKVSKIKSHLRAEEIAELRDMEARGEMKDMFKPLNITGALRIADAEKRLNLRGHERQRKSKSAFTRKTVMTSAESLASRDRPVSHSAVSSSQPSSTLRNILELKNDTANNPFVIISDKIPNPVKRTSADMTPILNEPITQVELKDSPRDKNLSVEGKSSNLLQKCLKNLGDKSPKQPKDNNLECVNTKHGETLNARYNEIKPESPSIISKSLDFKHISEHNTGKRTSFTVSFADNTESKFDKPPETPISRLQSSRCKSSVSRSSNQTRNSTNTTSSSVAFSCHLNAEKELMGEGIKTASFFSSSDSMSPYLGESPYEERRRMLLQGELNKVESLLEKKDGFLDKVDEYIKQFKKESAPLNLGLNERQNEFREFIDEEFVDLMTENAPVLTRAQIRMLKNQQKMNEQYLQRKKSSRELWKDINKCTYLRVPSDKIDLSGIVTLAVDQMKLTTILRPI